MAKKARSTKTKSLSTGSKAWRVALCILVPVAVGGASAALTMGAMSSFGEMKQPPLSPPAWLFPVAWTILYVLMGLASWLIFWAGKKDSKKVLSAKAALIIYGVQLVFNFCWSPVFFNFKWYWFAFGWLIAMWLMIIVLAVRTRKISLSAFWMLLPYILWCTFAAYLNCGIALLN